MLTYCPFRTGDRLRSLVRTVVVGSVLATLLPAGALGAADVRHRLSGQVFAVPSAPRGLPLPASAVSVPVQFRIRTGDPPWSGNFDAEAAERRDVARAGPAGASRRVRPARPSVTILTPTDLAAVPAGTLHVRGTVSAYRDAVRVLVNGVRAVVRSGAFSASVRVTPHTVILSAVATTPGGLTDFHQVGLAVSGPSDIAFPFRPFPDHAVVELAQRLSFPPAPASHFAQDNPDGAGAGDAPAAGTGGPPFAFGDLVRGYSAPTMETSADAAEATTMRLVLAPARREGGGRGTERGPLEQNLRVDLERAQRVLATHPRPEDRIESAGPSDPGSLARDATATGMLSVKTRSEADVEQNPRGMPLGATYSFGVLFIFDTAGFRQIRWY